MGNHVNNRMGMVGAIWGVIGVAMLLMLAISRLLGIVHESLLLPWHWYHYAALAISVLGMAFFEGYRGFQRGFSPRVAARARHVRENPRKRFVVLGPLFCASYFHARRRRQITAISVTLGISVLIAAMRHVAQPWRGIVDAGVLVGLVWGVVSLIIISYIALTADTFDHSPELPD